MSQLKKIYEEEIVAQLMDTFKYKKYYAGAQNGKGRFEYGSWRSHT